MAISLLTHLRVRRDLYGAPDDYSACGQWWAGYVKTSTAPAPVDCGACKRTTAYRERAMFGTDTEGTNQR